MDSVVRERRPELARRPGVSRTTHVLCAAVAARDATGGSEVRTGPTVFVNGRKAAVKTRFDFISVITSHYTVVDFLFIFFVFSVDTYFRRRFDHSNRFKWRYRHSAVRGRT